jgi:hypothetical protein
MISVLLMLSLSQAPRGGSVIERSHVAGEYFVQKAGTHWSYVSPKGVKAHYAITTFIDWRAQFTFSFGKKSASGHWLVRNGAWLEKSGARAEAEVVLLPATLTIGTRWVAPASLERGAADQSQFEVLALDAVVELPRGITVDHCLTVLESALDGSSPFTHYYAPNVGKVAVRGPDDWLFLLTEFRPGQRGQTE